MLNAIMLVQNRPILTKQALDSFFTNSKLEWTLVVVDDGSAFQARTVLARYLSHNVHVIRSEIPTCNVAAIKNLGVYWSERMFGRGDLLYLSDNDAYFTQEWDLQLTRMLSLTEGAGVRLIGPYRHPYHHVTKHLDLQADGYTFVATDAVQGIGHLMRWETWDKYGPLIWHPGQGRGTNQSEDFWFCQQIVEDGFLVGSIQPGVAWNCGLTGTNGRPSPGAEVLERHPEVYME